MTAVEETPVESPVIEAFKTYSRDLTRKHNKYERIVKIGRDITIESKNVIFAIHNLPTDKKADAEALEKIRDRFKKLVDGLFKKIAVEVENEDPYLYHRAYTWGVQEYVEALAYFNFVTTGQLVGWEKVVDNLLFELQGPNTEKDSMEVNKFKLLVPLSDYILGIQDMTGEVMRLCITTLGKGNSEKAQDACNFIKYVYAAFHILQSCNPAFQKKLEVAGQSLRKMEYGCYLAKIQGLEMKSR